ncbi:MAG: phenylalanine--tRNA ligase subunit beta [Candidatus Korarchaeota archaeon]
MIKGILTMPVLDTTLSRLRRYLGFDISLEELEELLFKIGFELDSIKEQNSDFLLKVDITPDRTDCLSTIGLARALRLYLNKERPKEYLAHRGEYKIIVDESVLPIRPYIAAVVVKELRLTEDDISELIWTQEKLHTTFCRNRLKASVGLYPLDPLKWPLRYYAENPEKIRFRPLGMDKEMSGREILAEHPTGIEYSFILKDKEKYPLFTDSEGKILSMPPIINSADYGQVRAGDQNILLETTGTHKETMEKTLNILATILHDMGGELYQVDILYPSGVIDTAPYFHKNIKAISTKQVEKILGLRLKAREIKQLLERAGYLAEVQSPSLIVVQIPPYRTDVFHEVDIIDDIARTYSYDSFEPELTPVFTIGASLKDIPKVNFIREILTGLGFTEAFTFSLTNELDQFEKMRVPIPETKVVKIAGAKEAKLTMVRYWLLPELLKMLSENKAVEYPIKMFEIEDIVEICDKLSAGARNIRHLAILISDARADYTQLKSVIEYLFQTLNIPIMIKRSQYPSFIEGRCAKILINDKEIGVLGELHPEVLLNFGVTMPVVAAELDLSYVLDLSTDEIEVAE